MMKTKIILFTTLIVVLSSCLKDEGNYIYHDINEIKVTGIASSYSMMIDLDTLEIDPVVTMTDGDIDDASRFEYMWLAVKAYQTKDTLSKTRKLKYNIKLKPDTYEFYLKIVDKQTGVTWSTISKLVVGTPYTKGILLIGENSQGNAQVQMLSMVNDTILFADMLKDSGFPAVKDPIDVLHTGGSDSYVKIWVLTGSSAFSIDRLNQKCSAPNIFKNMVFTAEPITEELIPVNIGPRIKDKAGALSSNLYRAIICKNGYVFNTMFALNGGDYYTEPVNREASNYSKLIKARPEMFYGLTSWKGFLWYDKEGERFMQVGAYTNVSNAITDLPGDIFPWNQMTLGRTLVYGENTLNTDGGSTGGNSFAIMKDNNGKYYIYKFYVGTNLEKRGYYPVKDLAINFASADKYAFSSKRTVLFYTVGKDLYAYDYNQGNEKCYKLDGFGNESISMIKFDTQIETSSNPLYIATYNNSGSGTLKKYFMGSSPDNVTLGVHPQSVWTGLVKITNMSWRAVK
jgi:hypothetical protein